MIIQKMVVGAVMTNCFIVSDEQTKDALVIDPGAGAEQIAGYLHSNELQLRAILLTHGHFDHILAADRLRADFRAKVYCLDAEKELAEDDNLNAGRMFRFRQTVTPDETFRDGEVLSFGALCCRVIATPGHTKGGACFYFEQEGCLFSGDTLFFESVGRTDLPTGNAAELVRSIKERLFVLPGETKVYPGHGVPTTIGYEIDNNPYINEEGYLY